MTMQYTNRTLRWRKLEVAVFALIYVVIILMTVWAILQRPGG